MGAVANLIQQNYGPVGLFLAIALVFSWRLYKQIEALKEAAFQKQMNELEKRIATLENMLNAVERALIKIGAWRE